MQKVASSTPMQGSSSHPLPHNAGRIPRYSTVFDAHPSTNTHFLYPLKNGKGRVWASVNLRREDHQSSNSLPILEGLSPVVGSVTLDLESAEVIQSLTLSVRGRAITGANEGGSHTFLDHSHCLWTKDQKELYAYRHTRSYNVSSTNSSSSSTSGKLSGQYLFPFSFILPTIDATGGTLPESFSERSTLVRIRYEMVLKIGRGRLRADSKLHVPIIYRRKAAPPPPSPLRQRSYHENTAAPSPDIDPNGWVTLSPVDCVGQLLHSRTVVLRCRLSLANPLSYTRGSFIPCHLRIESVDEQALDLLASPRTTIVRLNRRIRYLHDAGQGMQANRMSLASKPKFENCDVGQAIWRHDLGNRTQDNSRVRCLVGELHLPKDLPASADVVPFGVEYAVNLLAFESPTFQPNIGESSTVLQRQRVELVTQFGEGPMPVSSIGKTGFARTQTDESSDIILAALHKISVDLGW
ncbi:hypothetical protein D9757_005101 [Collybiopsis confluens]|uniref:Arrestin-like N-terminal domain-containing protein n=1 Tax=Collybiopsis confluens TaxID=2823264 RepID=A0A8H5HT33_9AGAR|nr:hypothetical protein D9757_005101 [Collybiopsis confluens]